MRRVVCSVKPQAQKVEASSTQSKITALEDRIASIREALNNPEIDEDESIELQQELSELEDELNFAWQDDEAEWDYARQQQEFNPDGSLKGYGDEVYSSENTEWRDDPNADLYVVKIWHEIEANAEDCYGPEAAEEIIDVVANSPEQAMERAKMQWSGPIDRIEIVGINPEDTDVIEPFMSSTAVTAADEGVKLQVKFDPYERYGSNKPTKTATVSGTDVLDALKKMADRMQLYITSEDIEDEEYTAEDVIDRIESENGDGCDFIYFIKNLTTNEMLLDSGYSEEEDWD